MPLPTTAQFTRYVLVVLGLLALALFIGKISTILLLVFAGIVFAAVIRAISTPLQRRTGIPDTWAVGLVSIVFAVLVVGGFLSLRQAGAHADRGAVVGDPGRVGENPGTHG